MAVSRSRFSWWSWKEKDSVSSGFCSENDCIKSSRKNSVSEKKKWEGDKQVWIESDGPDWSIGWVEPHGIDFSSDDDGFAVLVPCYRPGCKELLHNSHNQLLCVIKNLPSVGNKCREWPSSLGEN